MKFKDYLETFPSIENLAGLDILENGKVVHEIPAVEGKLGSLKLYNALSEKFAGQLTKESAKQGLIWFAEYLEDAKKYPGKHPNIDLLLTVIKENRSFMLQVKYK